MSLDFMRHRSSQRIWPFSRPNFLAAQSTISWPSSSWQVPLMSMYLQRESAKWQQMDLRQRREPLGPEPWMSSGWKKMMSPFFIETYCALYFSSPRIPQQALFTVSLGYPCGRNSPLCDPGIMHSAPFSRVASSSAVQPATMRSAGRKGKQARSWCRGCREDEPILGGLLMNMVCTDLMLLPQKECRQGRRAGLVQNENSTSSSCQSCSLVMFCYPIRGASLPLPLPLIREMSLTICMPIFLVSILRLDSPVAVLDEPGSPLLDVLVLEEARDQEVAVLLVEVALGLGQTPALHGVAVGLGRESLFHILQTLHCE